MRAQTQLVETNLQMTGSTNDQVLNFIPDINPVWWNGNVYLLPPGGTNVASSNGVAQIALIPNGYTLSFVGLPLSYHFNVTNSSQTNNIASLLPPVPGQTIYSTISQILSGGSGIAVSAIQNGGTVYITNTSSGGSGGIGTFASIILNGMPLLSASTNPASAFDTNGAATAGFLANSNFTLTSGTNIANSLITQSNLSDRTTDTNIANSLIVQSNLINLLTGTNIANSLIVQSNLINLLMGTNIANSLIVQSNLVNLLTGTNIANSLIIQSNLVNLITGTNIANSLITQSNLMNLLTGTNLFNGMVLQSNLVNLLTGTNIANSLITQSNLVNLSTGTNIANSLITQSNLMNLLTGTNLFNGMVLQSNLVNLLTGTNIANSLIVQSNLANFLTGTNIANSLIVQSNLINLLTGTNIANSLIVQSNLVNLLTSTNVANSLIVQSNLVNLLTGTNIAYGAANTASNALQLEINTLSPGGGGNVTSSNIFSTGAPAAWWLQDTNTIWFTNGVSGATNGSYYKISATIYTNYGNGFFVSNTLTSYLLRDNNQNPLNTHSGGTPFGPWSDSGAGQTAQSVVGWDLIGNGGQFLGTFNSTNITAQIATLIAAYSNYVANNFAISNSPTMNAPLTLISAASQGLIYSNASGAMNVHFSTGTPLDVLQFQTVGFALEGADIGTNYVYAQFISGNGGGGTTSGALSNSWTTNLTGAALNQGTNIANSLIVQSNLVNLLTGTNIANSLIVQSNLMNIFTGTNLFNGMVLQSNLVNLLTGTNIANSLIVQSNLVNLITGTNIANSLIVQSNLVNLLTGTNLFNGMVLQSNLVNLLTGTNIANSLIVQSNLVNLLTSTNVANSLIIQSNLVNLLTSTNIANSLIIQSNLVNLLTSTNIFMSLSNAFYANTTNVSQFFAENINVGTNNLALSDAGTNYIVFSTFTGAGSPAVTNEGFHWISSMGLLSNYLTTATIQNTNTPSSPTWLLSSTNGVPIANRAATSPIGLYNSAGLGTGTSVSGANAAAFNFLEIPTFPGVPDVIQTAINSGLLALGTFSGNGGGLTNLNLNNSQPGMLPLNQWLGLYGAGSPFAKSNYLQYALWQNTGGSFNTTWPNGTNGYRYANNVFTTNAGFVNSDATSAGVGVIMKTNGPTLTLGGSGRWRSTMYVQSTYAGADLSAAGWYTNTTATDQTQFFGFGIAGTGQPFGFWRFPTTTGAATGSIGAGGAGGTANVLAGGFYNFCISADASNLSCVITYPTNSYGVHSNEVEITVPISDAPQIPLTNFGLVIYNTNTYWGALGGRIGSQTINPRTNIETSDFVYSSFDSKYSSSFTTGDPIRIVTGAQYDTGTNIGILNVVIHGDTGTIYDAYNSQIGDYPLKGDNIPGYFEGLLNAGVGVETFADDASGIKDTWGNSNSIVTLYYAIEAAKTQVAFSNVVLWGESAGGITAINFAASHLEPVSAVILNHGAFDITNLWNDGVAHADINTAYGGSTPAQFATTYITGVLPNGFWTGDSSGIPVQNLAGISVLCISSFGDQLVIKGHNSDVLATYLGATISTSNFLDHLVISSNLSSGCPLFWDAGMNGAWGSGSSAHGYQCYNTNALNWTLQFLSQASAIQMRNGSVIGTDVGTGGTITSAGTITAKSGLIIFRTNSYSLTDLPQPGMSGIWLSNAPSTNFYISENWSGNLSNLVLMVHP